MQQQSQALAAHQRQHSLDEPMCVSEEMALDGPYSSLCDVDVGDDFDFDAAAAGVDVADIIGAEEAEAEEFALR